MKRKRILLKFLLRFYVKGDFNLKQTEFDEIKLELNGMLFTWDKNKEAINIRKHNINFTFAASVFLDNDAFIEYNSVDDYTGEERMDVIGFFGGLIIFIVYVERVTIDGNDIIRIISARKADKKERERYVNGN